MKSVILEMLVVLGMIIVLLHLTGCTGAVGAPSSPEDALTEKYGIYTCEDISSRALVANLSIGGIVYCGTWDAVKGSASCCYPTGWDGGAAN